MSVDVPRLRKVLAHITAHPEQHNQDWWAERTDCGTVMCVAGHTCVQAGLRIDLIGFHGERGAHLTDGRRVEHVAAELLGLDEQQALRLFHIADDLPGVWAAARYITGNRVTRKPEPVPN